MSEAILLKDIKNLRGKDRTRSEILELIERGLLKTIEVQDD